MTCFGCIRNRQIHRRAGIEMLEEHVDGKVLRWYGRAERKKDGRRPCMIERAQVEVKGED